MGQLLRRARLIERISDSSRGIWVIEAGSGYGKTVLLQQLRSECAHGARHIESRNERSDLQGFFTEVHNVAIAAGVTDEVLEYAPHQRVRALGATGSVVVIDNCERWDRDVIEHLGGVANDPLLAAPIVLAGRLIDRAITSFEPQTVGHAELAFTSAETEMLLQTYGIGDATLAAILHQLTGGWPAATVSAAEVMAATADPGAVLRRLVRSGSMAREMLERQLSTLSPEHRQLAIVLAALPFFDAELAQRAGAPEGLDQLRLAGLPINRRPDSWSEFVPTFRSSLVADEVPSIPPELIEYIAEKGEIHSAINAYLSAGDRERAAKLIAGITRRQETALDATQLHAAIAAIGPAVAAAPRCLYVHAHVSAVQSQFPESLASIERAADLFEQQDPAMTQPAHIETLLMLALWRSYDGDLGAAKAIVDRCEPHIDQTTANENRAMMHDVRGVLHHQQASDANLEHAARELKNGLALWRQLNQPEAATVTLFRLASGVLACSGRRREALALLDQLPDLGPMTLLTQGQLLLERSWLLPFLGRATEVPALLIEARRIAQVLDDTWLYGRSLIAEIVAASFDHQSQVVQDLAREALDGGYITFGDAAEAHYWVEVAEALARCGQAADAESQLKSIRSTPGALEWLVAYTAASLEARHGDASTAVVLLQQLELRDDIERDRRWQIALLRGYAHWRIDQGPEAEKYLQTAFDEAAQIGLPELPAIAERSLVESIRSETTDAHGTAPVLVTVFDQFTVQTRNGGGTAPSGRAATLLKLLVVNGGRIVVDQAIVVLWPDADLPLGRRRLRNVVRRLRATCGEIVDRHGDTLVLAPHVSTDVGQAAASRREASDLASIAEALALSDRQLMPDDRYEDWAEAARLELGQELVALLGRQSMMAESSDDLDLALASAQRAAELAPSDQASQHRIDDLLARPK